MKKNMNYVTALPDFIEMQRVSFCWFIAQGLSEELVGFSNIHDFSHNTEYILFGQEYNLVKPTYNITRAKKYTANYAAQLVIPLEVRNKKTNSIKYHNTFPIVNLPLMTTAATFIINGCERVIVSQIIRSPGIYFEKNKNQKKRKRIKRRRSSDIHKLQSFAPSGEALIGEQMLYFTKKKSKYYASTILQSLKIPNSKQKFYFPEKENKINWYWTKQSVFNYSFNYLKQNEANFSLYFLEFFKIYRIILTTFPVQTKLKRVKIFLQWLKLKQNELNSQNSNQLLSYFNILLKTLIKYTILKNNQKDFEKKNKFKNFQILLKSKITSQIKQEKIQKNYDKLLDKYQQNTPIKFHLIPIKIIKTLNKINSFNFLKTDIQRTNYKINEITNIIKNKNLKPTLYFSISLKEPIKYNLTKREKEKIYISWIQNQKNKKHKYLKTKSQILQYKDEHSIKDLYKQKYEEKDLYTAILIPEYGSWIRFGFQKNTKINLYKYPIKNQEDEVIIQIDKVTQKPVIHLLKEMGLTNLEICRNLQHSDFFYFNKTFLTNSIYSQEPLLRFDLNSDYYQNISEFSRIFDPNYYRLGKIGRFKINQRLNLKITHQLQTITYEDIFAIIDYLINLSISKTIGDDIDHLKNRRVRSVGELLQNLFRIGFQRLSRTLQSQINKTDSGQLSSFTIVGATIKEFFGSSQLSQYMDQTNPLSSLTHRRRISGLGPGGFDRDRISFAVRDIHPSHYGRICPIETPEGQNVGLIASLTTCARVNNSGFLETPFWRVINGKVIRTGKPIYLTADIEDLYKIAPADIPTNDENYLIKNLIAVRYKQDFVAVTPFEVDFIAISPIQVFSVAASLIPFFEHDDANRALMGSNMQRQSVPLILPQKPIVGTGLENQIAIDSGLTLNAQQPGIIDAVTADKIVIKNKFGRKLKYNLQKYQRSNQETCINQRPIVWKGEKVRSGQILTDGPGITNNELSLGQNVLIAYMPWQGYNFEDAILINERLVYEDVFTSIHIGRYDIEIDRTAEICEQTTNNIPNLSFSDVQHLNDDGIVATGTFVKPGDILVGKVIAKDDSEQLPESKLLRAIFGQYPHKLG